jgi:hypothetical protein
MNPLQILAQATQQLPPGVVWVYSSFIDTLITTAVMLGIGLVVVIGIWGITNFRTPKESKKITGASHAKQNLLCLAHDDGTLTVETAWRVGHEGAVETRPVGKQKKHWTGFLPRQSKIEPRKVSPVIANGGSIDEAKTAEVQYNTERIAEYINKLNTRSLLFPSARVKVWFAVKPKAVLASLEAIAAIQITEEVKQKMGEAFPVDILALKTMVTSASWNESQINALEEDKFHAGELSRANTNEDFKKMCLWLALPIMAIALLVVAMKVF